MVDGFLNGFPAFLNATPMTLDKFIVIIVENPQP